MKLNIQSLRREVKFFGSKNERVLKRFLALIELSKVQQTRRVKEFDYDRIGSRFDASGRTLYRWEKSYLSGGARALLPKKARGRSAVVIRGHTAQKIISMRSLYNWGAEVIQAHLELDHGVKVSRYRINRFLRKKGLLGRKRRYKIKNKHIRVVSVLHPGHHTQTDVKHLPAILSHKTYVYNFIDHASKWSFKRAYDSYGPGETRDFMERVIAAAPFTIRRLQSDNGVEFTNKYISHLDQPKTHALERVCEKNEIRHVLIPPGEKELQGLVERSHRQDDEEFYHRARPANLEVFNKQLKEHCEWRNSKRRRKALSWKTSNEFLTNYQTKIEDWLYKDGPSPFETKTETKPADECVSSDKKAA